MVSGPLVDSSLILRDGNFADICWFIYFILFFFFFFFGGGGGGGGGNAGLWMGTYQLHAILTWVGWGWRAIRRVTASGFFFTKPVPTP